jgi:hypothetical protein
MRRARRQLARAVMRRPLASYGRLIALLLLAHAALYVIA